MIRLLKKALVFGAAAVAMAGCIIPADHHHDSYYGATYTTIETGVELETLLGEGAGVFVEYLTGGQWRIWTSCDTAVSGTGCQFEIRAVAGGRIDGVTAFDTELDDAVELYGADTAVFLAYTEMASDEVEILTEAGDSLMLEVVLDGIVAPEYLVWYGSGYKHTGAATSPVVFEPDRP